MSQRSRKAGRCMQCPSSSLDLQGRARWHHRISPRHRSSPPQRGRCVMCFEGCIVLPSPHYLAGSTHQGASTPRPPRAGTSPRRSTDRPRSTGARHNRTALLAPARRRRTPRPRRSTPSSASFPCTQVHSRSVRTTLHRYSTSETPWSTSSTWSVVCWKKTGP